MLQTYAETHFLHPHLAVDRLSHMEELDEIQVEPLVEDRLVVLVDTALLDLIEIPVEQVEESVGRAASASRPEYGYAGTQCEEHFFGSDAAATEHQQPRLAFTGFGEQTEELYVLRQITIPARGSTGTLLEEPEDVEQRVRDGVRVDAFGKLEAGVLSAVPERLVRARRMTPGTRPELRVVRIVRARDGVDQPRRFHGSHRAGHRLGFVENPGTATAESDLLEPEGLRRIAAKQADDQGEQGAAGSLVAEAGSTRDVEIADDTPSGAEEDGCGHRLAHIAHHQSDVATSVA